MRKLKLRKSMKAAWITAAMTLAGSSLAFGAAQALPNGTIVNVGGVNYLTDPQGERYSGWFIDAGENWYYFNESDKAMKTGWHHDSEDGYWYYLNPADGKMMDGWQTIDGKEYFFQPVRNMGNYFFNNEQEKWLYSLNSNLPYGAMYRSAITPDGLSVDENGVKVTTMNNLAGNVPVGGQGSLSGYITYEEYVGEYTLENNYSSQSGSSLWLTITKIENDKVWANVQAGAGSLSGEAYGEVKGGKIENGKFTIVLDSILPPMSGSQRVQPYSIEFTFSTDKTINAKANQCIYDTLKDYEGKLCYIVD